MFLLHLEDQKQQKANAPLRSEELQEILDSQRGLRIASLWAEDERQCSGLVASICDLTVRIEGPNPIEFFPTRPCLSIAHAQVSSQHTDRQDNEVLNIVVSIPSLQVGLVPHQLQVGFR